VIYNDRGAKFGESIRCIKIVPLVGKNSIFQRVNDNTLKIN
jgi:hypothetical protein